MKETKEDSFCFLSAVIKKKVDAFREGIGYSGNFGKEMSSSPSATVPPTLTADQLTVIVASGERKNMHFYSHIPNNLVGL